jgi:hypothetical protein
LGLKHLISNFSTADKRKEHGKPLRVICIWAAWMGEEEFENDPWINTRLEKLGGLEEIVRVETEAYGKS